MAERGRKSAASLAVASVVGLTQRPEAPDELTQAEAKVWKQVVDSKPADWFTPGDTPLLADYCRHVVRQRLISKAINAQGKIAFADPESYKFYRDLLKDSEMETRAIKSLATALRLTQQSRYTPQAAATATKKQQRKPWEG